MQPKYRNKDNVPHYVVLISRMFLGFGIVISCVSALLLLLGYLIFLGQKDITAIERPGLLWIVALGVGLPGVMLGTIITVSSFGLRRMRIWGLLCSYIPVTMWIALYTPGFEEVNSYWLHRLIYLLI
jgi:uncharacterized RDD family membrane protein YckC